MQCVVLQLHSSTLQARVSCLVHPNKKNSHRDLKRWCKGEPNYPKSDKVKLPQTHQGLHETLGSLLSDLQVQLHQ
jgi:hypothetical protein